MNLFLDIAGGISGDMFMATLLGLGIDQKEFINQMNSLPIHDEFTIELKTMMKGSICGLKAEVLLKDPSTDKDHDHEEHHHQTHHHHRGLKEIEKIILASGISQRAKELSLKVFLELAKAEAEIHGTTIHQVHFHEVGAVDSIVDIVGTCLLIDMLGIESIYYNSLPLGGGTVHTEHGIMPVPAPATLKLMEGMTTRMSPPEGEVVTPTGAALLKGLDAKAGNPGAMEMKASSIGCGTKDFSFPNILRGVLFLSKDKRPSSEELLLLECNIDDMTGELLAEAVDHLLKAGALDAWLSSITMKKGRPAFTLKALCTKEQSSLMIQSFFDCTTTLGVRYYPVNRVSLPREEFSKETSFGKIRMKKAFYQDGRTVTKPEFDDLKQIALSENIPVIQVERRVRNENPL